MLEMVVAGYKWVVYGVTIFFRSRFYLGNHYNKYPLLSCLLSNKTDSNQHLILYQNICCLLVMFSCAKLKNY